MTVRELIVELLNYPRDTPVYAGKGMGPLAKVETAVIDKAWVYVVVSP